MVTAIGALHWVTHPELLRKRQREELVGSLPQILHEEVRHPVPRDREKADLLARRVHLSSHVLTVPRTAGAGQREVDDRDLDHGGQHGLATHICSAPATNGPRLKSPNSASMRKPASASRCSIS